MPSISGIKLLLFPYTIAIVYELLFVRYGTYFTEKGLWAIYRYVVIFRLFLFDI